MTRLLLIAPLLLLGCNTPDGQPSAAPDGTHLGIWADPSTGCRYLDFRAGMGQSSIGSLSIRFKADGTPDCPGTGAMGGMVEPGVAY